MLPAAALALSFALAASVQLQPGAAYPGDLVLVTVRGSEKEPSGTFGKTDLDFYIHGDVWQALIPLSVDEKEGEQELRVRLVAAGKEEDVAGTLEVLPDKFRKSELKVARKFTNPSAKQKKWMADDQRAFNTAWDQERMDPAFGANFVWPRLAEITAPFGDRRLFNGKQQSQHYGLDIDASTGDPIYAANDGKIVMVRECFGSGNTVIIFHGMGLYTAYFHLSKFEVEPNMNVKQGQLIGLAGKTGRVTGPHLHWGAKVKGRWVNAQSLIDLDFGQPLSSPLPR